MPCSMLPSSDRHMADHTRAGRLGHFPRTVPVIVALALTGATLPADAAEPATRASFTVGRDAPVSGGTARFTSVAVSRDGTVYAAEPFRARIVRFSRESDVIGAWGGPGSDLGMFSVSCDPDARWNVVDGPCVGLDVAVGPDGDVYVADTLHGSVQRFTSWGEAKGWVWPPGVASDGEGLTVAVGPDGTVYAGQRHQGRVLVRDASGRDAPPWSVPGAGDIAVDARGQVFVAAMALGSVAVFDPSGVQTATLGRGVYGVGGPGTFPICTLNVARGVVVEGRCSPSAVTIDAAGALLVRSDDGTIHRVDLDHPDSWRIVASNTGRRMTGLAVDREHRIIVSGDGLAFLDPDGRPAVARPELAADRGELYDPSDIAVAPDGTVLVVDAASARVLRRDTNGHRVAAFGGPGVERGRLSGPQGISVAPDGSIVVADTGNDRLQRFTATGVFAGVLANMGATGESLDSPRDVVVDGAGTVYAVDGVPGRIARFGPDGAPRRAWSVPAPPGGAPPALRALAIGPTGALVAADAANARVVALDADGGVAGERSVVGPDSLRRWPVSLAVAAAGDARGIVVGTADGLVLSLGELGLAGEVAAADGPGSLVVASPAAAPAPPRLLAGNGCGDDAVGRAVGLAVGPDGALWAVDGPGERIMRFGSDGAPAAVFGYAAPSAAGDGVLERPSALATTAGGVIVADPGHRRIQHVTSDGAFAGAWSRPGCAGETLGSVGAMAALPGGSVLVADADAGRVVALDARGAVEREWGRPGAQPSDLTSPIAVVALPDGGALVAEATPPRILRFDVDGRFVGLWGAEALARDAKSPADTATPDASLDDLVRLADGTLAALDVAGRRILVLDADGALRAAWPLPSDVAQPRSLGAALDGTVLVPDEKNNRLARFAPDGAPRGTLGEGAGLVKPQRVAVLSDGRVVVQVTHKSVPGDRAETWNHHVAVVLDATGAAITRWDLTETPPNDRLFVHWSAIAATAADNLLVVAGLDARGFDGTGTTYWASVIEVDPSGAIVNRTAVPIDPPFAYGDPLARPIWQRTAVASLPTGYYLAGSRTPLLARVAASRWRIWTTRDGPGSLRQPSGVAVAPGADGAPRLFVADAGAHRIARFGWDGRHERDVRTGLNAPRQIAAAPDGTLWVADSGAHRIVQLSAEGDVLHAIGRHGTGPDEMIAPTGVAIATDGTLRVADSGNRRILAFTPDGTPLDGAAVGPVPPDDLWSTGDIVFDAHGQLWVADPVAGRVHVSSGTVAPRWYVRYYGDGSLVDGPLHAAALPALDLDFGGAAPGPGLPPVGFSLRAAPTAPPGWPAARAILTVRGSATVALRSTGLFATVSGDPGAAVVSFAGASGARLHVDFAARGSQRPALRLLPEAARRFFPSAHDGSTGGR